MEKTLTIDGKTVKFKYTAGFVYRYRSYFGIDYSADIAKIATVSKKIKEEQEKGNDILALVEQADTRVYLRILWTLAKTADKTIPDIETWLDEFEVFNAQEIISQLTDLLVEANKSLIKN